MTEEIKSAYEKWLAQPEMPADLAEELKAIAGDEDAITDRFYRELEFGTGGLRGVIGAGTNRMNVYNIRKATQGLANYLNASDLPKKVAIGYDSRIKSDVFARETAAVLAANGIKAYIYPRLEPTPALSWAVRYYGCGAGVCVTASHNPAKYNGYKVYGADGCQITLRWQQKFLPPLKRWTALPYSLRTLMSPLPRARSSTAARNVWTTLWMPSMPSVWAMGQAPPT